MQIVELLKKNSLPLLFGIGYLFLAVCGLLMPYNHPIFITLWLPGGLIAVVLVLVEKKNWLPYIIAAFVSNIIFDCIDGKNIWLCILFASINIIDGVIGAFLFKRYFKNKKVNPLDSSRGILGIIIINGLIGSAFSSVAGGMMLNSLYGQHILHTMGLWWSGKVLGIILISPAIFSLSKKFTFSITGIKEQYKKILESIVIICIIGFFTYFVFNNTFGWFFAHKYLVLMVLIWAMFRIGPTGTAFANLIIISIVILSYKHGLTGQLWRESGANFHNYIQIQMFLACISITSIYVASVVREKKIAFDLLKESEKFNAENSLIYNTILKTTIDGYFVVDLNGYFLEVNENYLYMIGYEKSEIIGKHLSFVENIETAENTKMHLESVRQNNFDGFETQHNSKSGFPVDVEISVTYQPFKNNMVVFVHDITKRKSNLQALKSSEEMLKESQRVASVGYYVFYIKEGIWTSSEMLNEIFGIEMDYDRSVGNWLSIIHPDHRQYMAEYLQKEILTEHKLFDKEYKISRISDGEERWVHGLGKLEYDSTGDLVRMFGTIQDITNRKIFENLLSESEKRFKLLAESVNVVSWEYDLVKDKFSYVSPQAERILGYSTDEWTDLNWWNSKIHLDKPRQADFWNSIEENNKDMVFEYRLTKKNGSIVWIQDLINVDFSEGKPKFLRGIILDISERVMKDNELFIAKEKAVSANRAKSEFMSNISHEIRTPLNGINGFIQLLFDGTPLTAEQAECLNIISFSANNLTNIINDLLDFSRIDSKKLAITYIHFNLREMVENIISQTKLMAEQKGLQLNLTIDNNCEQFYGDKTRIAQIMINLISNAIKYTNNGGVDVEVKFVKGLVIKVSDTGIGIPENQVKDIFEPFRQLESPYTKTQQGVGLGLAIVKQLVDLMGGRIHVHSGLKTGSIFEIFLPIIKEQKETKEMNNIMHKENFSGVFGNFKILIVEDDFINQVLIERILKPTGFKMEVAKNGKVACEKALNSYYDVILMDIGLPFMNGLEVTKKIREQEIETGMHVPIIALTAHAFEDDRKKCFESGMDEYLSKPIDDRLLFEYLSKYLKN